MWTARHLVPASCKGATGAARAPKPGKAPIMAARCRCHCRLLFFKIEVRPRPCWPYRVRRFWTWFVHPSIFQRFCFQYPMINYCRKKWLGLNLFDELQLQRANAFSKWVGQYQLYWHQSWLLLTVLTACTHYFLTVFFHTQSGHYSTLFTY